MTLPFGPMTSPILSIGISKLTIFARWDRLVSRLVDRLFITSRICSRASLPAAAPEQGRRRALPELGGVPMPMSPANSAALGR